jgi:hypothetical protein
VEDSGRETRVDESLGDVVLFLAVLALIVALFVTWPGVHVAAVCLSIIGVGLKITSALRRAGRRTLP